MTGAQFHAKWKDIPIGHEGNCPARGGFDYEPCICGHDEAWAQRNVDLATVSDEDLAALRRSKGV